MAIETLQEQFIDELNRLYDAEHRFLEAQDQIAGQMQHPGLSKLLQQHSNETRLQIANLEQIYQALEQHPTRSESRSAQGLVADAQAALAQAEGQLGIQDCIAAGMATKIEHFEVACYRVLLATANRLGNAQVLRALEENLASEENMAELMEVNAPLILERETAREAGLTFVSTVATGSLNT